MEAQTLVSIKVNLEKQQKEIKSLDQQLAQMLEADAIRKEMLYRCEFEVSLPETIALIFLHCNQGTIELWYCWIDWQQRWAKRSPKKVIKEDRTKTRLHVVYDASAKSCGKPSLNDCLLPGPALSPLIFDILFIFDLQKVALIEHLEKAFLNVEVVPEERDFLRFLWIDVNSSNPEIITLRFSTCIWLCVFSIHF